MSENAGCEAVRLDGEDVYLDLADGSTVRLEVRDYNTDEPLDHAFDGGGLKLWLTEEGRPIHVSLIEEDSS